MVPGSSQVVIPAGTFSAPGGSLKGQGPWTLNDADGQALVDRANAGTDIVVDYEHQTLMSAQNGHPAPAAGWLIAGGFIWTPDIGVIATTIRWTTAATDRIREGEYRFLSPVFSYTPEGVPIALLSVALTNTPALTMLQELAIAANNRGCPTMDVPVTTTAPTPVTTPTQNQQAALSTGSESTPNLIATLTANGIAQSAKIEQLVKENAELRRQVDDGAKNGMITAALSAGKLMPGMEAWAMSMTVEQLGHYISNALPIAALTGTQTKGVAPKTSEVNASGLNASEIAVCSQFQIDHAAFIAQRTKMQEPK